MRASPGLHIRDFGSCARKLCVHLPTPHFSLDRLVMSVQTSADVPLLIISHGSQSERRISPSWTIDHLRTRLEPLTGIPANSQKLALKIGSWPLQSLDVAGNTLLSAFPLQSYAEIHVSRFFLLRRQLESHYAISFRSCTTTLMQVRCVGTRCCHGTWLHGTNVLFSSGRLIYEFEILECLA